MSKETGREGLLLLSRLLVYLALAGLLVFRGGWRGVLAAFVMVLCATAAEWPLIPVARGWAGLGDPPATPSGSGTADRRTAPGPSTTSSASG